MSCLAFVFVFFFFFNDTATTEIYTLSLHDALPISAWMDIGSRNRNWPLYSSCRDRKSTRLNSSHANISYAVFCLKKKKKQHKTRSIYKKTRYTPTTRRHIKNS